MKNKLQPIVNIVKRCYYYIFNRTSLNKAYDDLVNQLLLVNPHAITKVDAEIDRWSWIKSMALSRGPLKDAWPWMPFVAIRKLNDILSKNSKVFEYGAGGSTIYFASRVTELVSVEHDETWLNRTVVAMQNRKGVNWKYFLGKPQLPAYKITGQSNDPLLYTTSDATFAGLSFYDYVASIDNYPNNYFDVILIDGRSRPSCFEHAQSKIKSKGYIILDNAERPEYSEIEEKARKSGFEITEYWGPGPYNPYCWRTVFMRAK